MYGGQDGIVYQAASGSPYSLQRALPILREVRITTYSMDESDGSSWVLPYTYLLSGRNSGPGRLHLVTDIYDLVE